MENTSDSSMTTQERIHETNSPAQAVSGTRERPVIGVPERARLYFFPQPHMDAQAKRARSVWAIAYDATPQAKARPTSYTLSGWFDVSVVGLFLLLGVLNLVA